MLNNREQAIGIFDSGIGGLTVVSAVRKLLPNENIIYFGDTARVPYGDKSAETIQIYSKEIVNFLLQKSCKLILIACNSASAASTQVLREHLPADIPLLCVIDPVVQYVATQYTGKRVGLIGTKQTVNSGVFAEKIVALNSSIDFCALATPLLVPVIEEGFHEKALVDEVLCEYLSRPALKDIDALILGCTHYPLIKTAIERFYNKKIELIDSSDITAKRLANYLRENALTNPSQEKGEITAYLSDLTDASFKSAQQFFGDDIILKTP